MRRKSKLILLLAVFWVLSSICYAQEVQIPVDLDGKVINIDSELNEKINLFEEYRNFQNANLFQISDTLFVLEISYKPDNKLIKERIMYSQEDVAKFRKKVTGQLNLKKPKLKLNHEGRTKLVVGTTTLSFALYGFTTPVIVKSDDFKVSAALYLLTGSAGFYASLAATKNVPVSDAAASLALYGGTRGVLHGLLFTYATQGDTFRADTLLPMQSIFSIGEIFLGFHYATLNDLHPGTVEMLGFGSDLGLVWGGGIAHLFDFDHISPISLSILGGSVSGLFLGKYMSQKQYYTQGDAYVVRGSTFLGGYIPISIINMISPKDERVYTASAILGTIAGLNLGTKIVKDKNFSTGEGVLINLGEFVGCALGFGFAYIVSPNDEISSSLLLTSSAIGATAGFGLMYRYYANNSSSKENKSSFGINFNPNALISLVTGEEFIANSLKSLFGVSFKF
ncbi:MAG: hypothetical protein K8S23_01500 [Candidatus Cloacimonetes bacterium]|nr:hypothetical protein [Candidatus Cloacimonadota bacterium]